MRYALLLPLFLCAAPARADDLRDLCPERPGLGRPACIVDAGHVQVESGLADWTRATDGSARTDTLRIGQSLVRIGIDRVAEIQIGWTAFGRQRERDRATGAVDRVAGVGDVSVGVKRSLRNPDGDGVSLATVGYVTLPTGNRAIGAGDWGAGVAMPATFALPAGLTLDVTPEVDAAVDADRRGRHLAYGTVIGVELPVSKSVNVTPEVSITRDRDPAHHETRALAGLSLAWQGGRNWQVDTGANLALNHAADDLELYVGVARRF